MVLVEIESLEGSIPFSVKQTDSISVEYVEHVRIIS